MLDGMTQRMRARTMKTHRTDLTGMLGESVTSIIEGVRRDIHARRAERARMVTTLLPTDRHRISPLEALREEESLRATA